MSPFKHSQKSGSTFEAIAFDHLDALYNAAIHLAKNTRDAEALVQKTYLKAYRSFDSFRAGSNFRAWIFKILYNSLIDSYRKKTRRPPKADSEKVKAVDAIEDDSNKAGDPDTALEEIFYDDIMVALEKIPVKYFDVIMLVDVNKFSYKDAALILKCPTGTIMSRLSRARKMLSRMLKGAKE
ncbi:MAG: sigma-70 family RNA polymerase sigma factor [bacterium]